MIIYFSHSMADYNSEYEKLCLEIISKKFNNSIIINPKDSGIKDKKGIYENHFFKIIDKCDVVFCAPLFNNKYKYNKDNKKNKIMSNFTLGVIKEVDYSLKNGIKVMGIVNEQVKEIKDICEIDL